MEKSCSLLLLLLLFVCCLSLVSCADSPGLQTDFRTEIPHLSTEKNFAKATKHLDFRWLILFYRPQHDLSLTVQEVFIEAQNQLDGEELQYAAVDCRTSTLLCRKLKIKSFPTLMYYREGEGEEVYLRSLPEFQEFNEKVKQLDFQVVSHSGVLGDAFDKAHYLHPSGGVTFFFLSSSPTISLESPSFLAFSYQASLWKHAVNFYVVIDEGDLRSNLLSLLSDGVPAPIDEDVILVVRGPESISILELDFFEDEVEDEFFSSTTLSSEESRKTKEEGNDIEERLESLLRMNKQEKKKKTVKKDKDQRKKKRLLGERNKKVLGGWVTSNRYRIVEKVQPGTAKDLILEKGVICCVTFVGDLNSTADLAIVEKYLQTFERGILESGDLPDELTFAYAFVSEYPELSKKNGVRDQSKLPMTVLVDAHSARHSVLPQFTENQDENIQIVIHFLDELQEGNVRFRPSYYGIFDGFRYIVLKGKDFILGQPPIEFAVGLVVVAIAFVYYLCINYEDMSEREEIVREIMRKREEIERKKKEEEMLQIIEEEEKNIGELLKQRKKNKQDKTSEEKEEQQNVVQQLSGLVEMKNKGILTDEEFKKAKAALLKSE